MLAIELRRVTLARGGRIVLSNASIAIRAGEFVGVLGPNGAGKTTLFQAVLGLLRPFAGEIRVFDAPPTRGSRAIGYLPQHRSAAGDLYLRGWDFVASALRGERWGLPLTGRAGKCQVDSVIATVEATQIARRPLCELSGGELQRLLLAQALLGKPKLLLLDEPLLNLDRRFQQATVALVKEVQEVERITVLFAAHELNPLLGAVERVLCLGHGRATIVHTEELVKSDVLSRLYGTPVEVLHLGDRTEVAPGHGVHGPDIPRHHA